MSEQSREPFIVEAGSINVHLDRSSAEGREAQGLARAIATATVTEGDEARQQSEPMPSEITAQMVSAGANEMFAGEWDLVSPEGVTAFLEHVATRSGLLVLALAELVGQTLWSAQATAGAMLRALADEGTIEPDDVEVLSAPFEPLAVLQMIARAAEG